MNIHSNFVNISRTMNIDRRYFCAKYECVQTSMEKCLRFESEE